MHQSQDGLVINCTTPMCEVRSFKTHVKWKHGMFKG